MRLIDADALMEKLAPLVDAAKEDRELMALLTAMTRVRKMPTIEAVPTEFHDKCMELEIKRRFDAEQALKESSNAE